MSKLSVTQSGQVLESSVISAITQYRTLVAQRYTACPPTEIQRLLSTAPFLVSRKIDGELWFIDTTTKDPRLISPNGRIVSGTKILEDSAAIPKGHIIAGELYVKKDGRERVGDVAQAFGSSEDKISFAAFDIVLSEDLSWQETTYQDRLAKLREFFKDGSNVHVVETQEYSSDSEVIKFFNETVTKGQGEGVVVRCHDGRILKVKQTLTLDLAILAFTIEIGKDGGEQVRSVLLGMSLPDGSYVSVGATGNFDAAVSKADLLKVLLPQEVESNYRQAASSGQLYRFVRPQIMVECSVMDVQISDSEGKRIRQTRLTFSDEVWTPGLKVAAASVLNAIVLRERTDKPDFTSGVRWSQIAEYAEAPSESGTALPAAEIVRRQVWKKTTADKTDVRKLVVIKSNKELIDSLYPAFIVHWTDFSSTRKAPLAREVKTAPSLQVATEIAESMILENIKKGWEEVK